MTRCDSCGRPYCGHTSGRPSPYGGRSRAGRRPGRHGSDRPALTLVRSSDTDRAPAELSTLTRAPMPADVRGAIVRPVHGTLIATWAPLREAPPVPAGRVRLSWTAAGEDRSDVTAHLGLAGTEVLLAVWPGLRGEWSEVVRPTVVEVTELHSALRLATVVLAGLSD